MYACYIDESGHCGEKFNPNQPVEVLCGVVTDLTKLFKTNREHNGMLRILEEEGIPANEVKSSNIYRGRGNWRGVSPKKRSEFINELLNWAVERSCKFVVSPIDSKKFFERKIDNCSIAQKLRYPYEAGAFNIVLAVQRDKSRTKKNKGKTLVVFDEQGKHDKNLSALFDEDLSYTDRYTKYVLPKRSKKIPPRLGEIIDIPFFSKSHISPLIQVADLGAFVVNKYLQLTVYNYSEKYHGELDVIKEWYEVIGENLIRHTNINPKEKNDPLCEFYWAVRPDTWSAKDWFCHRKETEVL